MVPLRTAMENVPFCIPRKGIRTNPAHNEPARAPMVLIEYAPPSRRPSCGKLLMRSLFTIGKVAPNKNVGGKITINATPKRASVHEIQGAKCSPVCSNNSNADKASLA